MDEELEINDYFARLQKSTLLWASNTTRGWCSERRSLRRGSQIWLTSRWRRVSFSRHCWRLYSRRGHSLLTSTHGLSADNVLEWEVVIADGKHITATPTKHGDLYWALSGGGSGNYAVVLSVTLKAHADGQVGGTYLTFNSSGIGLDLFWEAVETFHALLPSVVDAGAAALYQIADRRFLLLSLTAPGLSRAEVIQLL